MSFSFWLKRFLTVFTLAFIILLVVNLVKQKPLPAAVAESALWAAIASSIFTATRVYCSRRGEHCALCGDTAETRSGAACPPKGDRQP